VTDSYSPSRRRHGRLRFVEVPAFQISQRPSSDTGGGKLRRKEMRTVEAVAVVD